MIPWNAAKAKYTDRLSVQRLKTLQQKKEAQAKAARREIATLLERGKEETSRIKVEALINEDIYTELLELLELYCELLLARFGLLDQNTREPDPGISESVYSIIHAAPRTEIKELHVLREILMHKYGRDFALAAIENRDNCVSERTVRKLVTHPPSSELVDAYLVEIAKGYGISWTLGKTSDGDSPVVNTPTEGLNDNVDTVQSTAEKEVQGNQDMPNPSASNSVGAGSPRTAKVDDLEALMKRFNALKQR
ncbi:hypothetical protein M378DRAFT_182995 [Amanita muscaria Koide BX008]|uniref:DUF292-domain-containing protein n=1 Tax=Amanita muscaria (strain Koide BX008) TaxID=946122 RepID=A0A0C2T6M5_AMAMK|nr:hypothetical protein M378DRAFT_182995 [Amanita muscaria Koide BX008]